MARKRKTNPVSPRLILLAGGAALLGTIATVSYVKKQKRKKALADKKKKEEGSSTKGGKPSEGKKKTLPPSEPLPPEAGAGYIHPGDKPPADFDEESMWISGDCRSWLIGKNYIPAVDNMNPKEWWDFNAAQDQEYSLATDGLGYLSYAAPITPTRPSPDVRFLHLLFNDFAPNCAKYLPKMDEFVNEVDGEEKYTAAVQYFKDTRPSLFNFANTLLALIQVGSTKREWGIDPDFGDQPWSMYSAITDATEGEIVFES